MVSLMYRPEVTGATFPGSDRAHTTRTPRAAAASRSTPPGREARSITLSLIHISFASVISNNLNVIMKLLASVTILMTVPNIVFSFYGMNVGWLPFAGSFWPPLLISVTIIVVAGIVLKKKDLL